MLFAVCADTAVSLGRFNLQELTDQMRMELLIDGMTDAAKRQYKDENGDYFEIVEWDCVEVDEDDMSRVRSIRFPDGFCEGSLTLDYIPPTVRAFLQSGGELTGTIETSTLPGGLDEFSLTSSHNMHGTIDFCRLPSALGLFHIYANNFSGSADLAALPKGLITLDISTNHFTGNVSLDSLPQSLEELNINANEFEGSLCLEALPHLLSSVDCSSCNFSGSLNLSSLPAVLELFYVNDNALSGELRLPNELTMLREAWFQNNMFAGVATVHSGLYDYVQLSENKIVKVFDEKGKAYDCKRNAEGFVHEISK